jgi:type IV fimbrial biogenesis protein FimT
MKTGRKRITGFTMVELLVTTALAAMLLGVALPSFYDMFTSLGLSTATSDMLDELRLARSEALKRNWRVTMCKSPDGQRCVKTGGWEQGWILFHDVDNNGSVGAGEEIISHHEPLTLNMRARGNQPVAHYVSFSSLGITKLVGGAFQAGTITLCRDSSGPTRSSLLVLNAVGRPRVDKSTVSNCV